MRDLPLPETLEVKLVSNGYPGTPRVTVHKYSHTEPASGIGAGKANALIYVCTETNMPKRWGFERLEGEKQCEE